MVLSRALSPIKLSSSVSMYEMCLGSLLDGLDFEVRPKKRENKALQVLHHIHQVSMIYSSLLKHQMQFWSGRV